MPEQPQTLPEEPGRTGHQHPFSGQLPQGAVHLEGRVELKDGLRPQCALAEPVVDVAADTLVEDPHEAADVFLVLRNHLVPKLEDI